MNFSRRPSTLRQATDAEYANAYICPCLTVPSIFGCRMVYVHLRPSYARVELSLSFSPLRGIIKPELWLCIACFSLQVFRIA